MCWRPHYPISREKAETELAPGMRRYDRRAKLALEQATHYCRVCRVDLFRGILVPQPVLTRHDVGA